MTISEEAAKLYRQAAIAAHRGQSHKTKKWLIEQATRAEKGDRYPREQSGICTRVPTFTADGEATLE